MSGTQRIALILGIAACLASACSEAPAPPPPVKAALEVRGFKLGMTIQDAQKITEQLGWDFRLDTGTHIASVFLGDPKCPTPARDSCVAAALIEFDAQGNSKTVTVTKSGFGAELLSPEAFRKNVETTYKIGPLTPVYGKDCEMFEGRGPGDEIVMIRDCGARGFLLVSKPPEFG